MAVLTADKQRPVRIPPGGLDTRSLPLDNLNETIYKGSVVVSDVSAQDGYFRAMPAATSTAATSGDIFGGIALHQQSITTSDSVGDYEVTVARNGVWGFDANSGFAITDIGAAVYVSDDDTPTTASLNNLWIGYIDDYDSDYVWVDIEPAAGMTNSAT